MTATDLKFLVLVFFSEIYEDWTGYSPGPLPALKFNDLFIRVQLTNVILNLELVGNFIIFFL